eukprot:g25607.t1
MYVGVKNVVEKEFLPEMKKTFEISEQYIEVDGDHFQFLRRTYEMNGDKLCVHPGGFFNDPLDTICSVELGEFREALDVGDILLVEAFLEFPDLPEVETDFSFFTILVLRELGELVFLGLAAVSCCIVLNVVHRELVLQRLNLPIFLTIAGGLGVGQAIKAERRRKEEEERKKREEEEAERRQIEEQDCMHWAGCLRYEESDKIQLEAERVRQALLERKKQEAEEETKKAEAELRRKAEAERLRREADAKNQKNQRILELRFALLSEALVFRDILF